MSRRFPLATCVVCAAAVLAGCGGTGHQSSTTTGAGSTSSTARQASAAPTGVRRGVVVGREFAGFTPSGVSVYTTIPEWQSNPNDQQSPAQAAAEKAMLTRGGFRGGAVENLTGPPPDAGLSIAEQFRSAAAARAALALYVSQDKARQSHSTAGTYVAFKVHGIPGAVGFTLGGATGGANIAFARGGYYILVGREGGTPADIAGLNAAAQRVYDELAR